MADIRYPAELSAAYNPVTVEVDSNDESAVITVAWQNDVATSFSSIDLERAVFGGTATFDLRKVCQSILGVGPELGVIGPNGVQGAYPSVLSKDYSVGEESGFVAVNASIRKGELEDNDLYRLGAHGVLSERPESVYGYARVIRVPRYEGFPSGISFQKRAAYTEEAYAYLTEGLPESLCPGSCITAAVEANINWAASATNGWTITPQSGSSGLTEVVICAGETDGSVTISTAKGMGAIYIAQVPYVRFNPEKLVFPADWTVMEVSLTVESNASWTLDWDSTLLDIVDYEDIEHSGSMLLSVRRLVDYEFDTVIKGRSIAYACVDEFSLDVSAAAINDEVLYWEPDTLEWDSDPTGAEKEVKLYHHNVDAVIGPVTGYGFELELAGDTGGCMTWKITRTDYNSVLRSVVTAVGGGITAELTLVGRIDSGIWFGNNPVELQCGDTSAETAIYTAPDGLSWAVTECSPGIEVTPAEGAGEATITVTRTGSETGALTAVFGSADPSYAVSAILTVNIEDCP